LVFSKQIYEINLVSVKLFKAC